MPRQPQVYQPDDRYFQQVMSNPEVAKGYIKFFDPDIASIADLDTLYPQKVKLLSPHLKLFSADVIYRCKLKAEEDTYFNFCLLFEHKSQPDDYVSVQVGLYIFLLMQDMVKQKGRKLEPVLPLLFYNGEKEWQPKTVRQLFQGFPHFEKLKPHVPDFEFLFEDAHRLPPGELLKLELSYFRTALMSMALKHRVDLIFRYFEVIFEGASGKGFSKNKIHNWFCSNVAQKQPEGGFCATLGQKLFESCVFYFCPTTKEERLATITYTDDKVVCLSKPT